MIDLSLILQRNPAKHYVLACSAGIDSMVLLHCFQGLKLSFSVAHVNYQLRGDASDTDALFLSNYCKKAGLTFHLKTVDLKAQLRKNAGNVQQEARNLRYRFLKEIQEGIPECLVVTAHHQNDQIETVVLHLLRNSGVSGLAGMPENNGWLFRPFLSLRKEELAAYAAQQGVPWREDESNAKLDYARNALRNVVIPAWNVQFPELTTNLLYIQKLFEEENQSITHRAQETVKRWKEMNAIPIEELKGSASYVVACFKTLGIEPRFLPAILALVKSENNKGIYFSKPRGSLIGIKKRNNRFILLKEETKELFRFTIDYTETLPESFNPLCWYLDASRISQECYLKKECLSMSFIPVGMRSPKKVNQLLKDARIPFDLRKDWPVFVSGTQIIGIPGVCLNQEFIPTKNQASYLRITFTPC
jgi:tRNA(Ile)-lysidine synthase